MKPSFILVYCEQKVSPQVFPELFHDTYCFVL
jgi:hypothetical protein